jgi:hypothetical protein
MSLQLKNKDEWELVWEMMTEQDVFYFTYEMG